MQALDAGELLFFGAVVVLSYAIRGSAGFGGATVPLLAWILSLKTVAPMVTFLGLISSAAILARDHRYVAWHDALRVMPSCLLGVLAGLYFFATLDARTLARALGVFVLAYGAYSLGATFRRLPGPNVPVGAATPVMGTAAGFVGTLFGANAGMFFAIYLDLLGHDKHRFRATVAAILLGLGLLRGAGYLAVGAYDREALIACAAALPLMAIGIALGNRIHANLDPVKFKRLVALVLIASGVPLVLR
ncbi:MAG TPA: sulfite exporter TauE/SafE family protein [Burkholderiales bacterium]|nr:sulfite exporter TauE/SafE family protein [Burkholderiales bacterium]